MTKIIKKDVRKFICNNFLFSDDEVQFDDTESFIDSGILDSTGILELILFLEERYGINVEDDEVVPENLDSIVSIKQYVIRKMEQKT